MATFSLISAFEKVQCRKNYLQVFRWISFLRIADSHKSVKMYILFEFAKIFATQCWLPAFKTLLGKCLNRKFFIFCFVSPGQQSCRRRRSTYSLISLRISEKIWMALLLETDKWKCLKWQISWPLKALPLRFLLLTVKCWLYFCAGFQDIPAATSHLDPDGRWGLYLRKIQL